MPNNLIPGFRSALKSLWELTSELGEVFSDLENLQQDRVLHYALPEKRFCGRWHMLFETIERS
ncbi:MAG TPA: hypothetical protein VFP05_13545 [Thermomicrobiales bacterium]|nr:hypothetical protein [Thermomicrobiales bacterium]